MMNADEIDYPIIDMKMTGRNLRRIMDQRGITVIDVRDYLGLAALQSVYHWLDGSSLPTIDNLYALSELFRVPFDMIIKGNRRYEPPLRLCLFCERMQKYYDTIHELSVG